jgi:hypothetical protein
MLFFSPTLLFAHFIQKDNPIDIALNRIADQLDFLDNLLDDRFYRLVKMHDDDGNGNAAPFAGSLEFSLAAF